jgi:hypothetical protein
MGVYRGFRKSIGREYSGETHPRQADRRDTKSSQIRRFLHLTGLKSTLADRPHEYNAANRAARRTRTALKSRESSQSRSAIRRLLRRRKLLIGAGAPYMQSGAVNFAAEESVQ